jgi:adenosylcobinamide-GDP ribazoletransferase
MFNRLAHELRLFLLALQFFTRIPVTGRLAIWTGWDEARMHASARHYPAVGLVVGLFGAGVLWIAQATWPAAVAVGLSMAATIWLTGGFHEDGLADTCDGLGGSVSRERALTIMKDSRLGSYGALGLIGVLGLKAATLHSLLLSGLTSTVLALLWAHAASRCVPVLLLRALPYAGDVEHAKAKPMAQQVGPVELLGALGWTLGLTLLAGVVLIRLGLTMAPLIGALLGLGLAGLFCLDWLRRRLGGYTGDTLGASQQLSELAALLGWLALTGSRHG